MESVMDMDPVVLDQRMKEFIALVSYIPVDQVDDLSLVSKLTNKTITSVFEVDEKRMERRIEWLDNLRNKVTFNKEVADTLDHVKNNPKCSRMSDNIMYLLRQCVITQRWMETVQLLEPLSEETNKTLTSVWKMSMELMMKDSKKYEDIVAKMTRELSQCSMNLHRHEIVVDYMMFLLANGRYKDAMDLPQPKLNVLLMKTKRMEQVQELYGAYSGLIIYTEWLELKELKEKKKAQLDTQSTSVLTDNSGNIQAKMDNMAERITVYWERLAEKPGVWDIFIYKLLEIYEESGQLSLAEKLLKRYEEKNGENISICKQWYSFYCRNNYPKSQIISNLKKLVKFDPSTSKNFELYQRIMEQDSPDVDYLTSMLFNMLDYSVWQNNTDAWKLFNTHLHLVFTKYKEHGNEVQNEWENRKDIWLAYHFSLNSADPQWTSEDLLYEKALSCVLLEAELGNKYTVAAIRFLEDFQESRIQEIFEECIK